MATAGLRAHGPAKGVGRPESGGLYPTVAISDAVNCLAHLWAARTAAAAVEPDAALGFGCVAAAALVGTLRFGFSERLFAQANGDLADLAAFVGLPLVGAAFFRRWLHTLGSCEATAAYIVCLAGLGAVCRSLPAAMQEQAKVPPRVAGD